MNDAPTRRALYVYNQWEKLAALPGLGAVVKKTLKPIMTSAKKGIGAVAGKAVKPAAIAAGVGVPTYLGYKAIKAGKTPSSMQKIRGQRQVTLRQGAPGVRSGATDRPMS